ncbi:phosphonate C-P lyase system protein PhnG [Paenibacillus planticolens]|uniref:Phosphonate C-P lyase system protein PhnG n=1 Tax=Paenibacillus planticolens TaxID=2654976 RepID=A0ABX1ZSA7_9BACL|nr:phosphonate C-P lyase system protein PhnG [Paenibacillus planticolens]NOV02949.1 phosphonate C-P lyase system protein PhnG [Paenibacillus planticolens]
MKRKQRTEVLINGSPQLAAALANEIKGRYSVAVMEEPNHGLVMVKVRETAQKSLFYLGEVLVTECKVQIEGAVGIGIVKGDEPEKAYDLAVIDAAYAARLEETEAWTALLLSEGERLAAKRQDDHTSVLRTKVDFETMDID